MSCLEVSKEDSSETQHLSCLEDCRETEGWKMGDVVDARRKSSVCRTASAWPTPELPMMPSAEQHMVSSPWYMVWSSQWCIDAFGPPVAEQPLVQSAPVMNTFPDGPRIGPWFVVVGGIIQRQVHSWHQCIDGSFICYRWRRCIDGSSFRHSWHQCICHNQRREHVRFGRWPMSKGILVEKFTFILRLVLARRHNRMA